MGKDQMSDGCQGWGFTIERNLATDVRDLGSMSIRFYPAEGGASGIHRSSGEFSNRVRISGAFVTFQKAVEALAGEVPARFSVWVATRWTDPLIEVLPRDEVPREDRCVRVVTNTKHGLRWFVDPADLHEPYGGPTTEPAMLRGSRGEMRGLVTCALIEKVIDEADARGEPAGLREAGPTVRLVCGQALKDTARNEIVFRTQPTGSGSIPIGLV